MRRLVSWWVRLARAVGQALGWRQAALVAALAYLCTWWDWAVQRSIDYVPAGVFLALSDIPGWLVATNVAALALAVFFALRLMPKVRLEFDAQSPRCVVAVKHSDGTAVTIFRLRVSYLGVGAALFSAKLAAVETDGGDAALPEPIALTFAPAEDGKDAVRKRIDDWSPANLDVAYVVETGRFLPATEFDPALGGRVMPSAMSGIFAAPGDYKLRVVVAADEYVSEAIDLVAHVTGDYATTTVAACRGDSVLDRADSSLRAIARKLQRAVPRRDVASALARSVQSLSPARLGFGRRSRSERSSSAA